MPQQQARDEALKLVGIAFVVALAVAARWRRLALSVSAAEYEAATAGIIADLTTLELEEGHGAGWPLVKRHKSPPLPDYPWAWFAAATCSECETPKGFNSVHDAHGFAPTRRAAHHAAMVAMHALMHGMDDDPDDE